MSNKSNRKSFTLIELLMAIGMIAVISLAIYNVFDSGAKIWQRLYKSAGAEDLNIFLDKLAGDLRNSFYFPGINFLGTENSIEFATYVKSPQMDRTTVGKAVYSYNGDAGIVKLQKLDYAQIYGNEGSLDTNAAKNEIIRGIKALKFEYYFYDPATRQYGWAQQWVNDKELPLAVRVELNTDQGDDNRFVKTISIPMAIQPEEKEG